ncbi:MAG: endopeptidase La [Elusimicrobiota bacterium]
MAFNMIKKRKNGSANENDDRGIIIPKVLPILNLRNTVVFPSLVVPLVIGRPRSIQLINDVLSTDKLVAVVSQKDKNIEDPTTNDIYQVGVVCQIQKMLRLLDQSASIVVKGLERFRIKKIIQEEPYLRGEIEIIEEFLEKDIELEALQRNVLGKFEKIASITSSFSSAELLFSIKNIDNPARLADFIAFALETDVDVKQKILEEADVKKRLGLLLSLLDRELEILELGTKINSQVRDTMEKGMREHVLREQLRAIKKELGDEDEQSREANRYRKLISESKMPPEVEKEALRELERFAYIPQGSPEFTVSKNYLDWLVGLPWSKSTVDRIDIAQARQILNEDHYDLEKVKERILEYLAVRKLKPGMKGPILCFVGPPGVGKTSLGRSIARSLGRKFIRISLGGMHDEAEIRGHRRTYIGSMPGRIIQNLRKVESNNPVFMLDEVDKIGADFRGDPASALLEVLDPEQNFSFTDHYLETPFDLSKVMFIATANIIDPIPPALKDRMEVLELAGYTEEEKLMIAKTFIISKQLNEHGLTDKQITFEDEAVKEVIRSYTREAGLRNMEREIATIIRKVAKNIVEGLVGQEKITPEKVAKYLGVIKFFSEAAERTQKPGVATGLAWTPVGGEILFIEATKMKGKEKLLLTGSLGDVMKESAQTALSYIRSRAAELGIDEDFYAHNDIHIHVPAGSIPKDGPSAGITIATAIVSLLTNRPIKPDLAMTGEITLRGKILPVGGIKEKSLAARRAGIKTILMSKDNEKDLEEVPPALRAEIRFIFVKNIDEVLEIALGISVVKK